MPKGVAVTTKRKEQSVCQADALSGVWDRDNYQWDAIGGSERLRDATIAAVANYARAHHISNAEAAALLLGAERRSNVTRIHPSATDYTGHRPSEVIARPIGEIIRPIVEGMEIAD